MKPVRYGSVLHDGWPMVNPRGKWDQLQSLYPGEKKKSKMLMKTATSYGLKTRENSTESLGVGSPNIIGSSQQFLNMHRCVFLIRKGSGLTFCAWWKMFMFGVSDGGASFQLEYWGVFWWLSSHGRRGPRSHSLTGKLLWCLKTQGCHPEYTYTCWLCKFPAQSSRACTLNKYP